MHNDDCNEQNTSFFTQLKEGNIQPQEVGVQPLIDKVVDQIVKCPEFLAMLVTDGCMNANQGAGFQLILKGSDIETVARVGKEVFKFNETVNGKGNDIRKISYGISIKLNVLPPPTVRKKRVIVHLQ